MVDVEDVGLLGRRDRRQVYMLAGRSGTMTLIFASRPSLASPRRGSLYGR